MNKDDKPNLTSTSKNSQVEQNKKNVWNRKKNCTKMVNNKTKKNYETSG